MALDSTVKVKFLGDAANLAREAARASKATDQVGKSAENAHSHLMRMAKGFAIGVGIGAAGVAIERFAKSSVNAFKDAAAEAGKLSRLTGLAAEDASRLGFAAHETGVDVDDFTKALGILSKNLSKADQAQTVLTKSHHLAIEQVPKLVKGHLEYVAQLKNVTDVQKTVVPGTQSLGFALRDANGHLLPMSKLLPEIADKFKSMKDGPEKTALALKLFGRGGAALLPFLNKGAEGLAEFGKQADKLGITMSGKDVASYRAYVRAQREFHAAMNGIKITLGRELFPLFTAWGQAVADHAPQINAVAREYAGKLVPAVQSVVGWVKQLVKGFDDGSGAGGQLRDAMKTTATVATGLADVLIPMVRFLAQHPRVFFTLAAGVLAFKAAAAAAAFRASALGIALFGVAGGEAAVTAAGAPAIAAMTGVAAVGEAGAAAITGIGTAAVAILGPLAILAETVALIVKNWDTVKSTAAYTLQHPFATSVPGQPESPFHRNLSYTLAHPFATGVPKDYHQPKPLPVTPPPVVDDSTPGRSRSSQGSTAGRVKAANDLHATQVRMANAAKDAADKAAAADKAVLDKQLANAAAAQKVADAKQAAADALQKASDAMKQALTDRLETAKGIRDSLVSSNSVVRDGLSWTAKDLLSRFRTQMDKVRRFSAAIQEMVRKGYSPAIVAQVSQAGVQGGMGTAIGLAHASSAQVRQFNAVQGGIERYASSAGGAVASQMGPIQITTKVMLNDRELARAVNTWNAENAPNGHRLAS